MVVSLLSLYFFYYGDMAQFQYMMLMKDLGRGYSTHFPQSAVLKQTEFVFKDGDVIVAEKGAHPGLARNHYYTELIYDLQRQKLINGTAPTSWEKRFLPLTNLVRRIRGQPARTITREYSVVEVDSNAQNRTQAARGETAVEI